MTRLEFLRKRLEAYCDAELKILNAQRYKIADRELQRANLSEIRRAIDALEAEISLAENPNRGIRRAVFVT